VKGLLVFAVALGALLWAASWAGGPDVACPAIGWGSSVRVELTGDWSAQPVGVVELECSTPCERLAVLDEVTGEPVQLHEAVDPLSWPVFGERPGSAVATVLAPDGSELARVESQLEFERVGGTEECGGPMRATVTGPAP
jgi:hypothetical protein